MDHSANILFTHSLRQLLRRLGACNVQFDKLRIADAVDHHYVLAPVGQESNHVRADVAGASSN